MKKYYLRNILIVAFVLCIAGVSSAVTPFDDAVFRVTFANSSVDDVTSGNVTTGTAEDVYFEDVDTMTNGNGKAAYFDGISSGINYGLGAANELQINGSMTQHIRVRFDSPSGEEWLMGRFGNSMGENERVWFLHANSGDIGGKVSSNGINSIGPDGVCDIASGTFYDVYMRFKQSDIDTDGYVSVDVFDAEKGAKVASSATYMDVKGLYDSADINFWVGRRGNYFMSEIPLQGAVEQINVWDRALDNAELEEISGYESALESMIFHVGFDGSFDDTKGDDISTADYSWGANLVDVDTPMYGSNGKGVDLTSSASMIKYGLGANNELRLQGEFSYHARVKFDRVDSWDFVMGRWGDVEGAESKRVNYMYLPGPAGQVRCAFSKSAADNGDGVSPLGYTSPDNTIEAGVFYDIFFSFMPGVGSVEGNFFWAIYNAETAEVVWRSSDWVTTITGLWEDDGVPFTIGGRYWQTFTESGFYDATESMDGVIEQVNVWDIALTDYQMEEVIGIYAEDTIECGDRGILYGRGDINKDCKVDFTDFALFANDWLEVF
jgi:hypothetical protein